MATHVLLCFYVKSSKATGKRHAIVLVIHVISISNGFQPESTFDDKESFSLSFNEFPYLYMCVCVYIKQIKYMGLNQITR